MADTAELILHETTASDGSLVRTTLSAQGDRVCVRDGRETRTLPLSAIETVVRKYGKTLTLGTDEAIFTVEELSEHGIEPVASLDLGDGRTLVHFRFMPRYEVIAHDYLAFFAPGQEALCEHAVTLARPIEHLARTLGSIANDAPTTLNAER